MSSLAIKREEEDAEEQRVESNRKQNERRGKQHKLNSQIPKARRLMSRLAIKREEERALALAAEEPGAREKEALDLKARHLALLQEFEKKQPVNGVSFTQARIQLQAGMVGGATFTTDQVARHQEAASAMVLLQETASAMVQPVFYDPVHDTVKRS